jgi:hypothetical protein
VVPHKSVRRPPRLLRQTSIALAVPQELAERSLPGPGILRRDGGDRDALLVETLLVTPYGSDRQDVVHAQLRLGQAAHVARQHRNAAQHGLDRHVAEGLTPDRRHEQHAGLAEDLVDVRRRRPQADVRQRRERRPVLRRGPPGGHREEGKVREAARQLQEDRDPLDRAGVDQRHGAAVEIAQRREGAFAVDREAEHGRRQPGPPFEVVAQIVAEDDDPGGPPQQVRAGRAAQKALRSEGQVKRRMGDVDHPLRADLQRDFQQHLGRVFGRHQDPVRGQLGEALRHVAAQLGDLRDGVHLDSAMMGMAGHAPLDTLAGDGERMAGVTARGELLQQQTVPLVGTAQGRQVGRALYEHDLHT